MTACSDDETENGSATGVASPMQVLVVFEPGELGDQGFADDVLRGTQQIEASQSGAGQRVADVEFWSLEDAATTASAIATWQQHRQNPFYDGAEYARRLIVLTQPTLLRYLDPAMLDATDDVLLLDASPSLLEDARYASLDGRLSILNISAASSAHRFCDLLENWSAESDDDSYTHVLLQRWYEDAEPQDSVAQVLKERLGAYVLRSMSSVENDTTMDFKKDYSSYLGYLLASSINEDDADENGEDEGEYGACIIDMGAANAGFDMYLLLHNPQLPFLLVDAESSLSRSRYAITRHFGRALQEWVAEWLRQPADAQPRLVWHGGWDGYSTNDIPDSDFVQ